MLTPRTVILLGCELALFLSCRPRATQAPTPSVAITSPTSEKIIGSRSVSLAGTISSEAAVQSVEVKLNGATVTGVSFDDDSFSAALELGDNTNSIEVTVNNGAETPGTATKTVEYPFLRFTTFQPATLVFGQANFTTGTRGDPSQSTVGNVAGDPFMVDKVLYVPHFEFDRVVGFNTYPKNSGALPDFYFGQETWEGELGTDGSTRFNGAASVTSEGGKFYAVDVYNHRIKGWNAAPTAGPAPADFVLGQPDPSSASTEACNATKLLEPWDVDGATGKLVVVDSGHNRVLIWNSPPSSNLAPADLVLGQGDFTHCTVNDEDQNNADDTVASARTLNYPGTVWTDGTRLMVVDYSNHRVLIWKQFPTSSFTPADVVLGQPDATSRALGATATAMNSPWGVASNGNQIFVADYANNRVLIWNSIPGMHGAPADVVLGQGDMTHVMQNDDNQDAATDAAPTARTLNYPDGLGLFEKDLWVADSGNHRWIVYRAQ
jgi:hypothetical protein